MESPHDLTRESRDNNNVALSTRSAAALASALLITNQFNTSCERLLVVHDDLTGKGLGWTTRNWQTALLVAASTGRVLHEAPAPPELGSSTPKYRWCLQPPHTHECFYQRWNDCDHTPEHRRADLTHHPKHHTWGVQGLRGPREHGRAVLHMQLSEFPPERWSKGLAANASLPTHWPAMARLVDAAQRTHDHAPGAPRRGVEGLGATLSAKCGFGPPSCVLWIAATRFLFRPRRWVRSIGECVLARAGIPSRLYVAAGTAEGARPSRPATYAVIFVRDSAEKRAELASHSHGWPSSASYFALTMAITTHILAAPRVVLQTSSLSSYKSFAIRAANASSPLRFGATDNNRSDHDAWGGMQQGKQTAEGTIAAVNLYLASEASLFLGLSSSAWTHLVAQLMVGGVGEAMLSWCCMCRAHDHYAQGYGGSSAGAAGTESSTPPSGHGPAPSPSGDEQPWHTPKRWLNGTGGRMNNMILLRAPQHVDGGSGGRLTERAFAEMGRVRHCALGPVPLHSAPAALVTD